MKKIILTALFIHLFDCIVAHPGTGIVQNRKGDIFYTDLSNVWKVSKDGKSKHIVVSNVHTHELALDQEGNLYGEHLWYDESLNSNWAHYVWKYDNLGKFSKIIDDTEGFRINYSFDRDDRDYMYWIEEGKTIHNLVRKSKDTNIEILSSFEANDIRKTYISKREWIYFIDDNDLYKIKIAKDQVPIVVATDLDDMKGSDPKRKPNNNTMGIWDDPSGNVYVAVYSKGAIIKVDSATGNLSTIYASDKGWAPSGGLIDMDQHLWVIENNSANEMRVKKIGKSSIGIRGFNNLTHFTLSDIILLLTLLFLLLGTLFFNKSNLKTIFS